jgi:MFS transporter, ACS family, DAL5 transporter family protein
MASQPLQRVPREISDEMHGPELSPESSATTRLTPDSDSDESDLEMGELGESFKLHRREKGEVGGTAEDGDQLDDEKYHDAPRRRASVSTVQSYQLYTPDEERAVIRKFDRRLVLFVALLYMLSFLDRSSNDPSPSFHVKGPC